MVNFEKMGTQPHEANAQLRGFEIAGAQEELNKEYENLFEEIESEELSALFKEFGALLEEAPEDVITDIEQGKIDVFIDKVVSGIKCSKKRAQQIAVFALVSMMASPAFADGKEDALRGVGEVVHPSYADQSGDENGIAQDLVKNGNLIDSLHILQENLQGTVVLSDGVQLAPQLLKVAQSPDNTHKSHQRYVSGITIDGQRGEIISQDGNRIEIGVGDDVRITLE